MYRDSSPDVTCQLTGRSLLFISAVAAQRVVARDLDEDERDAIRIGHMHLFETPRFATRFAGNRHPVSIIAETDRQANVRQRRLGDVNQADADMRPGVNIRGVVDFIPAG